VDVPKVLRVAHLVDCKGTGEHLWGKERVVALLMREQRASGSVDPMVVTFSPGMLGEILAAEGFRAASLSPQRSRGFDGTVARLGRFFERHPVDVIHSHGYRANIVARALRVTGRAPGVRLVSTCHGWVDPAPRVRFYNVIDRLSSVFSDVTTVPDPRMLRSFRAPVPWQYIPNAVAELDASGSAPPFARPDGFVAGTLGRVTAEKGIPELLEVAGAFPDRSVVFAVAGDGDMTPAVRSAGDNVHYAGYFPQPDRYLEGLDVYVQASRREGLSLSLLEAMRAGKAIVATDVGGTRNAVTDGESALVIPARKPEALRDAVLALRNDPALRSRLGARARERFERDFHIRRQHEAYLDVYAGGKRG
jgi:glycosyltransferase involved in cell wall biosynthesis